MIDARRRVREETFEQLKAIAIRMRLSPVKLARMCRRLHLDTVALASYVKREVLRR